MWLSNQKVQNICWYTAILVGMVLFGMNLSACSSVTIQQLGRDNQENLKKIAVVSIDSREGQLYVRELRKLLYIGGKSSEEYELKSSIRSSSSSTLSVQGTSSTLKKMSMSASFILTDLNTEKTLVKGNVAGDATFGAVTSLYGQDKSESHARERLAVLVAQRVVRRLQLYFLNHQQP